MKAFSKLLERKTRREGVKNVAKRKLRKWHVPVAVLVASGGLVGCATSGQNHSTTSSSGAASAVPVRAASAGNGTVTITYPSPPGISSLDPSQWAAQILVDQGTILEGLYGYNQQNQIVPKIASGYSLSKDGLTWTIYLRHDARWSNGDPVTAQDFYYAWMRQLNPANSQAQLWASVLNNVKNAYQYHSGAVPASQVGIKVINNYELQITTTTPHYILGELAVSASMPLDPKVVNAHPTNWYLPQYFVGDGPYVVKSFTPNGTITLVPNPKYVGHAGEVNHGNAKVINLVPGTTVAVEDYMAGKLDVALVGSPSDLQYIKTHNLSSQLHVTPDYSIEYLEWDHSADPSPYYNPKVREAIAMAMQRQPIVQDVLDGMGGVTNTFATPGWPAAKYEKGLPENVTEAKKLLAQAGYPNGKGLPVLYLYAPVPDVNQQGVPVAEAVSQELQQNLGIQTKIIQENQTDYSALVWEGPLKGIQPGFVVAAGAVNWFEPANMDIQASQGIYFPGDYGWTVQQVQHVLPWYNSPYDPASVAKYGNPQDPNTGVSWNDWLPLQNEVQKDIAIINKWTKEQPAQWQAILNPPGTPSLQQQWNQIVQQWKSAKTASAKHAAFVLAWEFVAPESATTTLGGTNTGALDVQAWWDTNESQQEREWRMWQAYEQNSMTSSQAAVWAGKLVTSLEQQAWVIPLYYNETFYLEKPWVTGAQPNPWAWGNFYQFQYLSTK
nr:peptide ABC transporter substrate-binding protein [Alicyclobacillus mali (ex Roth et al. 2021)]